MASLTQIPPSRDHVAFVPEPKASALVRGLARGLEIAVVRHDAGQAVLIKIGRAEDLLGQTLTE